MILTDYNGNSFELESQPIAKPGGEGAVFAIRGKPDLVAKIYHDKKLQQSPELEQKLSAMISSPVAQPSQSHLAVAWPQYLLYEKGRMVGFVMPKITGDVYLIKQFYNPSERKLISPGYTRDYLYRIARNLAVCVEAIHKTPHVIGDLNPGNILVDRGGLVSVIDTDSFQVQAANKEFRCEVGVEEFSPPEILKLFDTKAIRSFADVRREQAHDRFAMAIMIFRLLCGGAHPYAGILQNQSISVSKPHLFLLKQSAEDYHPTWTMKRADYLLPDLLLGFVLDSLDLEEMVQML